MPNTLTLNNVNAILMSMSTLQSNDPKHFLQEIVEIIHTYVNIYFLQFFLLDSSKKTVVFSGGTAGEITEMTFARRYSIATETIVSSKQIALSTNRNVVYTFSDDSFYSLDLKLEADYGQNYAAPLLPETRVQLSLPLRFQGELVGLWRVMSSNEDAFDLDDIMHFQMLADQITVKLYLLSS